MPINAFLYFDITATLWAFFKVSEVFNMSFRMQYFLQIKNIYQKMVQGDTKKRSSPKIK